jgi:hypothetical protein
MVVGNTTSLKPRVFNPNWSSLLTTWNFHLPHTFPLQAPNLKMATAGGVGDDLTVEEKAKAVKLLSEFNAEEIINQGNSTEAFQRLSFNVLQTRAAAVYACLVRPATSEASY